MRWALLVVGMFALVAMGVLVAGSLIPRTHTATAERQVAGSPEDVWAVINEVEAFPSWRPDVDSVRRLPDRGGGAAWTEYSRFGALTMEVAEHEPPLLLVTRIADEGLPFGGTWTFRLEAGGGATRVTITENGEIHSAFFRFVSRYVTGYESTMIAYLDGLERRMAGGAR